MDESDDESDSEQKRNSKDWDKGKRCAYSVSELAPIFTEKLVAQPNLSAAAILGELYPKYLQHQPTVKFANKVKSAAKKANAKQEAHGRDKIEYLQSFLVQLNQVGFTTTAVACHLKRMEEIVNQTARAEHAEKQKIEIELGQRDPNDREAFPGLPRHILRKLDELRKEDEERLESGDDGLQFYQGQIIIFPWARHVLQTAEREGLKVYAGTDCGHCWGPGGGTMYHLVVCDANRGTIPLAWAHFAMNEGSVPWLVFMQYVAENLPLLLHMGSDVLCFRDGAAAISNAMTTHLPSMRSFYCTDHASKAAAEAVAGPEIMSAYNRIAMALTSGRKGYAMQQAPTTLTTFLSDATKNKFADSERFLADLQAAGGQSQATLNTRNKSKEQYVTARTTSQMVEVNMWSSKANDARGMEPVGMGITVVEAAVKHMMDFKAAADSCLSMTPPQVTQMLEIFLETAKGPHSKVEFRGPDRTTARVQTHTNRASTAYHQVNLNARTCTCGFTALTDFPCECLVCASKAAGRARAATALLKQQDTTPFWQAQYAFDFAACALPTEEVWNGKTSDMRMPLLLPRSAGRPRVARHTSWTDGFGSASVGASRRPKAHAPRPQKKKKKIAGKTVGAAKAISKTYVCGRCGQPKKGHVCTAKD